MQNVDVIVAGAGIWGCSVARCMAEKGRKVLVLEKRAAVGGNVRCETDPESGIEIHAYGSHIFQDLVEAQILYTAVFPGDKTPHFHPELLKQAGNKICKIPQGEKWRDVVCLADVSQRDCILYHDLKQERVLLRF